MNDNFTSSKPVEPTKPTMPSKPSMIFPIIIFLFMALCLFGAYAGFDLAASGMGSPLEACFLFIVGIYSGWKGISSVNSRLKKGKASKEKYNEMLAAYENDMRTYRSALSQYEEQCMREEQEHSDWLDSIRNGVCAFPSMNFYKECIREGITDLSDRFSYEKAKRLLPKIFGNLDIADYGNYTQNLQEYFDEGKTLTDKDNVGPKEGKVPEEYKCIFSFHSKYSRLHSDKKRKAIVEDTIKDLTSQIENLETASKTAFRMATSAYSLYDTKSSNAWAYAGGAASALGGPVAGAMVASSMYRDDLTRTTANKAAADRMFNTFYDASMSRTKDVNWLKRQKSSLSKLQETLDSKIIFNDCNQDDLFRSLSALGKVHNNEGYTEIEIEIKNTYKFGNNHTGELATDGVLEAKLLCDDDTTIDFISIVLPQDGIPLGQNQTLYAVSDKYMEGKHTNFRAEIYPVDLWITEI